MKLKCSKCGKEKEVANLALNSVCSCGEPLKTQSMGLQFNEKEKPAFHGLRHLMSDLVSLKTLEGVDYLVVPTILIVEGVHNNVFYPSDELKKFPESWNGRPVVINHPDLNGQAITANSPDIVEKQTVGALFNVKYKDGKLKGEVWINIEKCRKISEAILDSLHNNEKIEVSTGLFTECDGIEGEWNGEKYVGTVFNYRPDHLALLPNDIGACSWEDGGGMPRVNERGDGKGTGGAKQKDGGTDSCVCPDCGATVTHDRGTPCAEMSCPKCGATMTGMTKNEEEMNILKRMMKAMSLNEASHSEVWMALSSLLDDKFGTDTLKAYVVEVYDNSFIYADINEGAASLYKQNYAKNADDSVQLDGDPSAVKEVRQFVPVTTNKKEKEETMNKAKFVDDLIANSDWTEDDKELLLNMSEEQLKRLSLSTEDVESEGKKEETPAEKKEEEVPVPAENKEVEKEAGPKTPDDLIANIEDPEIKATLKRALARDRQIKTNMVASLVSNKKCKFTEVQLNAKEIEELDILMSMLGIEENESKDFSLRMPAMKANAEDENAIPAMPSVFEKK